MTVLLAVYDDERCLARCDANCYLARHRECGCICGGVNHGVGEDVARANVKAGIGQRAIDIERFKRERSLRSDEIVVIDRTRVKTRARATALARDELWMRRHQLPLPFDEPSSERA